MILPPPPVLPPLHYGPLRLASRYLLAPLAGYTNLSFRLALRTIGGLGLATTDLINARALLVKSRRTCELLQTCPEDRPVCFQIYGSKADEMAEAAQWLEGHGATVVDINMGCPVHKVVKGGGGSAMMCDMVNTVALVRTVVEAVRIPVTVKMRLGWDADNLSAPYFARKFEEAGVAAVIIHGRTREQGFGGKVDLSGIRAVVEAVDKLPVIGNGDVRSIGDANRMLRETGCSGIAIGRGALLNPWIFQQLRHWEETGTLPPAPTLVERLRFMDMHFHLLVEHRGPRSACLTFRKVANWYCRALHPGRAIQQELVQIDSVEVFEEIVARLGEILAARPHEAWDGAELSIKVPSGPVSHW